jgi:hypothetical protein
VEEQLKDLQKRLAQRRRVTKVLTSFELHDGRGASGRAERMPRMETVVRDVQPGESLGWIKQSEQDLERTSRLGEEVAASFSRRLEAAYPERFMSLWCDVGLIPGDYSGLTRYFLAQIFGDDFWTPLEASDTSIVIPVKPQTLEKLVHGLMQGSIENSA